MKEMKCKRCGANENRIHGFCSMECETAWEYEDEIRDLTARIAELTECIGSQMADVYTLKARIAELKESDKHWAGNVKVCMQLVERYESAIAELEAENETLKTACDILRGDNNLLFKRLMSIETPDDLQTLKIVYAPEPPEVQE